MDVPDIVSLLVLVALVPLLVWVERKPAIRSWRVRRRHRSMAATPIAELADHQIRRIVGRVAASEQTLTAPLTGRPCVLYQLVIYAYAGRDRWSVHTTDRRGAPFAVSDHSATAIVDPYHSWIALKFDHREETEWLHGPTSEQAELLRRYNIYPGGRTWPGRYRLEETVIAIGDPIGVIGAAVRDPAPPGPVSAYRTDLPSIRLRIAGSEQAPLAILCGPQP